MNNTIFCGLSINNYLQSREFSLKTNADRNKWNLNDFSVELIREREMCECENSTDCTDLNNLIISVFSLQRVRETTAQCCRGSRHY